MLQNCCLTKPSSLKNNSFSKNEQLVLFGWYKCCSLHGMKLTSNFSIEFEALLLEKKKLDHASGWHNNARVITQQTVHSILRLNS